MNRLIAACACLVVPFVAASSLSLWRPTSTRAASGERSVLAQGNAQQLYNSGVTRAERGDYQGAIQDFTQAIGVNPNFADAYVSRGEGRIRPGGLPGGGSRLRSGAPVGAQQCRRL